MEGDSNEEGGVPALPGDLVREGAWGVKTLKSPSDLGEERNREDEPSVMVADRVEKSGNAVEKSENALGSLVWRDRDVPPDDDCCPICFGDFEIPCKTSCGHWFCASCILTLWKYRGNALRCCQCPICCHQIIMLEPEASLLFWQEDEVVEALKKVQRYNRLFAGGAFQRYSRLFVGGAVGLVVKLPRVVPLFFRSFFRGILDPHRLDTSKLRLVAFFLAVIYQICGFDFIPTGGRGIVRVFDCSALVLALILSLIGIFRECIRWCRARLLQAAPQPRPA